MMKGADLSADKITPKGFDLCESCHCVWQGGREIPAAILWVAIWLPFQVIIPLVLPSCPF